MHEVLSNGCYKLMNKSGMVLKQAVNGARLKRLITTAGTASSPGTLKIDLRRSIFN